MLYAAGLTAVGLLVLDVAGALAGAVTGDAPGHLLTGTSLGRFVYELLRDPASPVRAFAEAHVTGTALSGTRMVGTGLAGTGSAWTGLNRMAAPWYGTATFWATVAVTSAGVVALFVAVRRLFRPGDSDGHDGFASRAAVMAVASLRAVQRTAAQTRPSLLIATGIPTPPGHRRVLGRWGVLDLWSLLDRWGFRDLRGRLGRWDVADRRRAHSLERRLVAPDVGYRLGRSLRPPDVDLVASFETSLRLVAPPGEGKTLRVLWSVLCEHPGPALATSTKADLYEVSVAVRTRRGSVFALDPDHLVPGAAPLRWSPVAGCEDTHVAQRRAAALIAAGGDASDVRSGAFFRRAAESVLASLLHAAALGGASMADVVRWAAKPLDPAPLRILTTHSSGQVSWADRLARHTSGAKETTSGVLRTLDLALAAFQHEDVLELCCPKPSEAFDFAEHLSKKGTVYALGKDRPGGVGPLVTAFCEELCTQAELASFGAATRRLDPPLLVCLDEAPSIAPLPSLPGLLADGRGRGIVVIYAMQSFSQAIERWGREGAATLANATTLTAVFGGLKVESDLAELSKLCGTRKVLRHSASRDPRSPGQSISSTWVDEAVLEPGEIRMLGDGELLLLWGKLAPVLAYAPGIWEHDEASSLAAEERAARVANDEARALLHEHNHEHDAEQAARPVEKPGRDARPRERR